MICTKAWRPEFKMCSSKWRTQCSKCGFGRAKKWGWQRLEMWEWHGQMCILDNTVWLGMVNALYRGELGRQTGGCYHIWFGENNALAIIVVVAMDRLGDVLDIWMEEGVKSPVFPRKIFDEWIAGCPGLHTKQWGTGWVDVCQGSAETLGASHCCLMWTGVPRNALVMAGSKKHCSLVTGHVLHSCWSYPDPWCEHLRSFCLDLLPQWWRPSLSWHHQQGVNMSSCGQPEHRGCLQWGLRCTCQGRM